MFGTAVVDIERGQFADVKPYYWQTDTAVALNSWCYTENNTYRPALYHLRPGGYRGARTETCC